MSKSLLDELAELKKRVMVQSQLIEKGKKKNSAVLERLRTVTTQRNAYKAELDAAKALLDTPMSSVGGDA